MKKKLAMVLFLLLLCVVGLGFYRGWFALSSPSPESGSNQVNVNLTVDPDRMKDDAQRFRDKSREPSSQAAPAPGEPGDPPADAVKSGNAIE